MPIELCHHATVICEGKALTLWMKQSTAIYSRQRFEVSERSPASKLHCLGRSPSQLSFPRFLPFSCQTQTASRIAWTVQQGSEWRERTLNVQHPCFLPLSLFPSLPPSRLSNRGMQRWHVDNQPWGPATSKAWRAPKNTNVRPNGTLH